MNIVNKQVNDTKTFGPIPAENSLNLNFLTGEIEDEQKPAVIPEKQPETNVTNTETSNNSELLINELASSQASSSTGAVIGGVGNFINKSKMYIFAVLVIAVIGVLVMYGFRRKKANTSTSFHKDNSDMPIVLDKDLSNAEEKLRQVQREINRIKNQGKIKEAEKRVAQDQSDLDNLRKGL